MNKFWEADERSTWREWKRRQHWLEVPDSPQWTTYEKEVNSRRIKITEGTNIISWGYKIKGMFTIQEGYYLKEKH